MRRWCAESGQLELKDTALSSLICAWLSGVCIVWRKVVYFTVMKTFAPMMACCLLLSGTSLALEGRIGALSFVDVETGVLSKIGGDTPHDYLLVPTMISWRTPEMFGWELQDGSRLLVRNRLTFIAQAFAEGPESVYGGFSASPSVEWWDSTNRWSIYGGAGGGLGWLDHQDVPGAFGQSLTLNWFGKLGVSFLVADELEVRLGAMFQHMSNGGMTDPNPGLDALGGTLGITWRF